MVVFLVYELRLFKLLSAQSPWDDILLGRNVRVVAWCWQGQDIYGSFGIYVLNHLIITVTLVNIVGLMGGLGRKSREKK